MEQRRRYPIGKQDFVKLIEGGYVYVDKTAIIYNLVTGNSQYVFLGRPRRFGKSLLLSTLKSYFEGRKDLFEGLAISHLEKEWKQHPVIYINLVGVKGTDPQDLWDHVDKQFVVYEKKYAVVVTSRNLGVRLSNIANAMHSSTGQDVVILIDEYDKPMLNVVHEDSHRDAIREELQKLYAPIKELDPILRFVFITGITKFSQMSIFSALNNIKNISMNNEYASICGITKDELLTQMDVDIRQLADALELTRDETVEMLRLHYDGYKFSSRCPDIFNPYSLLNCFDDKEFKDYWFESGTPTYLIHMLRKHHVLPSKIGGMWAAASDFDRPTESLDNVIPLLYQSGYLTIKKFDKLTKSYFLDIPNQEVRLGLMDALLPYYVQNTVVARNTIIEMLHALHASKIDQALQMLRDFLKGVPQCDNTKYEGHWQQMFYVIFSLFGAYGNVEVRTADGRVDFEMTYLNRLYLFELKIDQTAEAAMAQINDKDYPSRFKQLGLPIIKVGVNIDTVTHNLSWLIDE